MTDAGARGCEGRAEMAECNRGFGRSKAPTERRRGGIRGRYDITRTRVVYGNTGESLVFINEEEAHDLVQLHRALGRAGTWGEFRAQAPPHWYEDAVERLHERMLDEVEDGGEDAHEEPSPEQRFDAGEIPGHVDGDWPGFPHVSMGDWIPDEVKNEFGSIAHSWGLDGDSWIQLAPDKEAEIISAMRRHGYECVSDDDLVWEARGYG
jgi:hypothetical protein